MAGEITIKWSSKEYAIHYADGDTVETLKRKIQEETRVQPKRQKIMGLKAKGGKMAADDTPLTELAIKTGAKLMMLGCALTGSASVLTDWLEHVFRNRHMKN